MGCADPDHVNPPHVHGAHTHAATSNSTSTSTSTSTSASRSVSTSASTSLSTSTSTTTKTAAKAAAPGHRRRDVYVVDNVMAAGSFFALAGSARVNPNVTAGFNITVAFDTGARSSQVSGADDDGQPTVPTASAAAALGLGGGVDTFIVVTLANWYLDHKSLGRVTLGRANTATAGLTTIDLGGAGVIANSSIGYTQRGFSAVGTVGLSGNPISWANLLGGNTVNGAGLSRANVVHYQSPTVGGFSLQAAWGENDVWDVALRYAGEFSGVRFAAGIGYISNSTGLGDITEDIPGALATSGCVIGTTGPTVVCNPTQLKGSASILHVASGLYLSGAYVRQDNDIAGRADTTLWYLNGGISKNWTGLGNTVLYGEYARVDNALDNYATSGATFIADAEATMWGVGIVQYIDAAAMEVFLSYKNFSADVPRQDVKDFDVVMGGGRIRF